MDETAFCYWLNGFFEISGSEELTSDQVKVIKEHLKLVFKKETKEVVKTKTLLDGFRSPPKSDRIC
jgi:hypothetical protein